MIIIVGQQEDPWLGDTHDVAFNRGCLAYYVDLLRLKTSENPYPVTTSNHEWWLNGWRSAERGERNDLLP